MKLQEMYKRAIEIGTAADPRGKDAPKRVLKENKERYDKLSDKDKKFYDAERLNNPYSDTRILHDTGKDIKTLVAGIDIDDGELIAAQQKGIDAAIGHHPEGIGLASLDDVMYMQAEVLSSYGVPINIAESLLQKRISEVSRSLSPGNHYRVVDLAKLLDMPFACLHTVADNMAYKFLKEEIEDKEPYRVGDIFDMLLEVPEYAEAEKMGFGPRLFAGKKENRAGKVAVTEVTGGTEGAPDIYERLATAGVGTIIAMHQSKRHQEEARKAHINVVIAGHMSSDSIGMNLILDDFEKKGVEIIPVGGLIRHSRN